MKTSNLNEGAWSDIKDAAGNLYDTYKQATDTERRMNIAAEKKAYKMGLQNIQRNLKAYLDSNIEAGNVERPGAASQGQQAPSKGTVTQANPNAAVNSQGQQPSQTPTTQSAPSSKGTVTQTNPNAAVNNPVNNRRIRQDKRNKQPGKRGIRESTDTFSDYQSFDRLLESKLRIAEDTAALPTISIEKAIENYIANITRGFAAAPKYSQYIKNSIPHVAEIYSRTGQFGTRFNAPPALVNLWRGIWSWYTYDKYQPGKQTAAPKPDDEPGQTEKPKQVRPINSYIARQYAAELNGKDLMNLDGEDRDNLIALAAFLNKNR